MKTMTVNQLRGKYLEVCGEPARSRHKQWLIRRIAWQMQAKREGGISERALARARELAQGAQLRTIPPREPKPVDTVSGRTTVLNCPIKSDPRLPMPGSVITRNYKGRQLIVTVLPSGQFEFDGTVYRSLTAVAEAVTGSHCSGYHFFGLSRKGGAA